ncbi:MAG: NAD(P)/FAD-dependent oxidoreductase, partial [Candidatus Dormibacteraceae bacterium]
MRYVIIGNGIAGQSAAEELLRRDSTASVVMITGEPHPLYNRVALPRYLQGQLRREKVFLRSKEDYQAKGIEIHFESWVREIDPGKQLVRTDKGREFAYDALLVATGGRPKPPPWPGSHELPKSKMFGFQTLDDTDRIIEAADEAARVLVLGGSFIAYELAEGIAHRQRAEVTWVMRGPWFLRDILDAEGGGLCRRMGEERGVEFICTDEIKYLSVSGERFSATTMSGRQLGEFDLLVYGVGLDYYVEPLSGVGVELRRGVVTDVQLRTALPNIYAAGDVAVFFDRMLGTHNQMGTWDNAKAHGVVAAHNMAGENEEFFDVPTYTTTMFGSTLAVMGITPDVHPGLESVRVYAPDDPLYRKLFFLEERLVGAVMIGSPK